MSLDVAGVLTRSVEALWAGDTGAALRGVEEVLAAQPKLAIAHLVRGRALLEAGDAYGAFTAVHEAVRLGPDSAEAHATLGATLLASGRLDEARAALTRALELAPNAASIHVRAAALELECGEWDTAERHYRHALRSAHPAAHAGLLAVFERRGDLHAAEALLSTLNLDGDVPLELRLAAARVLRRLRKPDEARRLLERIDARRLTVAQRVTVEHALGDVLDENNEPELAFAAWKRANDLRGSRFDESAFVARVDDLIARFRRDTWASFARATARDERPVFVIGAPRSGTSLVEQMLACHPDVFGAGELDLVPQLARGLDLRSRTALDRASATYSARLDALAPGARRVTDKLPHNVFHLGEIALLFPAARIVHVQRDPLDTGLSIYSRNFHDAHDYATDLRAIGVFLRETRRLMSHWREHLPLAIHELSYETLVADPEAKARDMLAFLDLEWFPGVMKFHEQGRVVNTASYAQVRQPLYSRSVRRAQRFAAELEPLRAVLERG